MGCKLRTPEPEECQVLIIRWNTKHDQLIFDFGDVCERMKHANPTKRNAVSLATRFFDPLGVLYPITIRFKILFQQLCKEGLDWDEPLSGEALTRCNKLSSDLENAQAIVIPQSYKSRVNDAVTSARLVGYCDASKSAYAATVYLQLKTVSCVLTEFVCSKTRVAPLKELTIPRLELLSTLLLAWLISTLQMALKPEVRLEEPVCNTDSQVALHWISGDAREWKTVCPKPGDRDQKIGPTLEMEALPRYSESCRYPIPRCFSGGVQGEGATMVPWPQGTGSI